MFFFFLTFFFQLFFSFSCYFFKKKKLIQKVLEKVNAQLNPDDFVFLMYYRDSS